MRARKVAAAAGRKTNEAVQRARQQEIDGDSLMQIAILVGHRPRPPSSSSAPLFLSFFFPFPIFSRSGIAAGAQAPKVEKQPVRGMRRGRPASMPGAAAGEGIWNSIGAALPCRWIVRSFRAGL